MIIPEDRERSKRDPSTVTPWPRDDPGEMFALVAVLCTVATGGCMEVQEEEEEENEKMKGERRREKGKVRKRRVKRGGSRKSNERSKKSTR